MCRSEWFSADQRWLLAGLHWWASPATIGLEIEWGQFALWQCLVRYWWTSWAPIACHLSGVERDRAESVVRRLATRSALASSAPLSTSCLCWASVVSVGSERAQPPQGCTCTPLSSWVTSFSPIVSIVSTRLTFALNERDLRIVVQVLRLSLTEFVRTFEYKSLFVVFFLCSD